MQCEAMEHNVTAVFVGGAGQNIHERLGDRFPKIKTICLNTNAEHLKTSSADLRIQLGKGVALGRDCLLPEIGECCAEKCRQEIAEALEGSDLVFIITGLGGGTSSGVSPFVTALTRQMEMPTIGIAIMPFSQEGPARRAVAEAALSAMREHTILTIAVENDSIHRLSKHPESLTFREGMAMVDEIVLRILTWICELATKPYEEPVHRIMESEQGFEPLEPRTENVEVPRDVAFAADGSPMNPGAEDVNSEPQM
ncbi:MAG: hypothetical protein AB1665_05285 [Candidatus Thermoplasmatota archaeon]